MAKILIIETDRILAENMCTLLSGLGHEASWFVDPQQAVLAADKQSPDLVILDFLLASHNGIEFLYEFRSYPEWQQLPVVVFSNVPEKDLSSFISSLEQLNISAYHYKPHTTLTQLVETIDRSLMLASV